MYNEIDEEEDKGDNDLDRKDDDCNSQKETKEEGDPAWSFLGFHGRKINGGSREILLCQSILGFHREGEASLLFLPEIDIVVDTGIIGGLSDTYFSLGKEDKPVVGVIGDFQRDLVLGSIISGIGSIQGYVFDGEFSFVGGGIGGGLVHVLIGDDIQRIMVKGFIDLVTELIIKIEGGLLLGKKVIIVDDIGGIRGDGPVFGII